MNIEMSREHWIEIARFISREVDKSCGNEAVAILILLDALHKSGISLNELKG